MPLNKNNLVRGYLFGAFLAVVAIPLPAAAQAVNQTLMVNGTQAHLFKANSVHGASIIVTVGDRVVIRDTDSVFASIKGPYQGAGPTYVLVEKSNGGDACPAMFPAIVLSEAEPGVSKVFGTCADMAKPSMNGDALEVTVPAGRERLPGVHIP